jgi:triacylglycerol lipase
MWLSQLAYEDEDDKIDGVLHSWGLTRIVAFERALVSNLPMTRTGGFVARGRGAVFVSFEGTDPLVISNWVTNFDLTQNTDDIHRGFEAALHAVWADVLRSIDGIGTRMPVVFTGHSLGGALAILAGSRLLADRRESADAIYTFGAPRVGGARFATAFNASLGDRTFRLVHGHDIVPTVPPSELDFLHVGKFLACPSGGSFRGGAITHLPSDEPAFASVLLDGTKAGLLQLIAGNFPIIDRMDPIGQATRILPPGIADHLPDRYWRALKPN